MTALLLKLHEYAFDFKCQQDMRILVGDALSRLNIETNLTVHDIIPLHVLHHFSVSNIYLNYEYLAQNVYEHEGKIKHRK